ncbi:MAG: YfcE family phosphodiesterase [Spirochaetota bacterium]
MNVEKSHTLLVIADLHGSYPAYEKVSKLRRDLEAELLIAGDISAGGTGQLQFALARDSNYITAVAGNSDHHLDKQVLPFPLPVYVKYSFAGRTIFMTHGHNYISPEFPPKLNRGDILISAHTHIPRLEYREETGLYILNPGSVARPRGASRPSYAIITPEYIEIREFHSGRREHQLQLTEMHHKNNQ